MVFASSPLQCWFFIDVLSFIVHICLESAPFARNTRESSGRYLMKITIKRL